MAPTSLRVKAKDLTMALHDVGYGSLPDIVFHQVLLTQY
jgi:hypothetical protein